MNLESKKAAFQSRKGALILVHLFKNYLELNGKQKRRYTIV